jgi:hypothetical protein
VRLSKAFSLLCSCALGETRTYLVDLLLLELCS